MGLTWLFYILNRYLFSKSFFNWFPKDPTGWFVVSNSPSGVLRRVNPVSIHHIDADGLKYIKREHVSKHARTPVCVSAWRNHSVQTRGLKG